jgi:hypothetical protein
MRRGLTVIACIWALLFIAAYIAIARSPENNGPAWWYVGVVVVGVLVAGATLTGAGPRLPLAIATVLFGIAILLGLLSVGLLLVPAAVLTAVGALRSPARTDDAGLPT